MTQLLTGLAAIFMGSVVQGCVGFAFSLVAAPFLLFVMPQTVVIPVLVLISMVMNVMVLKDCGRHLDFRKIVPILAGGVISLPLGIHLLTSVDAGLFRIAVGAFIVLVALIMASGWRHPLPQRLATLLPIGLVSGVLNGSISMSGPPVVLFLTNQGVAKEEFRANLAGYFFSLNCFTIVIYLYEGVLDRAVLLHTAIFVPVLLAGTWLGIRLSHIIPEGLFRKFTFLLIILTGAVLVVTNL